MAISIRSICAGLLLCWSGLALADIPLHHVTMYTSGVGYFEHADEVGGPVTVELRFREEQIPDVLKSLVVLDAAGGSVLVTYDAQDPLTRTLRGFAIDLSDHPDLETMLSRLRGANVEVKTSSADTAGQVIGTETRYREDGDQNVPQPRLNLHTAEGIRSFPLESIQSLRIQQEELAADFEAALEVLASGLDTNQKSLRIHFEGEGDRGIQLGYLLESPLWKTSYRLVIEDNALFLQGWGHIDNVTDHDWKDVRVSLIAGSPISFQQDLHSPIYVERPVVEYDHGTVTRPPALQRQLESPRAERRIARSRAASPMMALEMDVGQMREQAVQATGQEAGELFRYDIDQPVHIPRQSAAMLPIVQAEVEGRALSVFNRNTHVTHPLNAVEFENTSEAALMQGPVTVFEGGVFAGDARLPHTGLGEARLLGFAVDLATDVDVQSRSLPETIMRIRIVQGVLRAERSQRNATTYVVNSTRDTERELVIEHPYRSGWDLKEPSGEIDRTADHYRLRLELAPSERTELRVVEERMLEQTFRLIDMDDERIDFYLRQRVISPAMEQLLTELGERRQAIGQVRRQREAAEAEREEEQTALEQLRKNMEVVDRTSETYARWERELSQRSDQYGSLIERIRSLRAEEAGLQDALAAWLASANVE